MNFEKVFTSLKWSLCPLLQYPSPPHVAFLVLGTYSHWTEVSLPTLYPLNCFIVKYHVLLSKGLIIIRTEPKCCCWDSCSVRAGREH